MLMLAVETATEQVGVALADDTGVIASFQVARGRRHAETLVPAIEFLMAQAVTSVASLTALAVDVGPGLFTGMRVGLATAKAMAHALELPVVPVCSLDVLAARPWPGADVARIVSVLDARRSEVFWASYGKAADGGRIRLDEPRAASPDDLLAELALIDEPVVLVGSGAVRYRERFAALADATVLVGFELPDVTILTGLAVEALGRGEVVEPLALDALYLRAPDAEINWRTRDGGGR